jgi:hypothetical protein
VVVAAVDGEPEVGDRLSVVGVPQGRLVGEATGEVDVVHVHCWAPCSIPGGPGCWWLMDIPARRRPGGVKGRTEGAESVDGRCERSGDSQELAGGGDP